MRIVLLIIYLLLVTLINVIYSQPTKVADSFLMAGNYEDAVIEYDKVISSTKIIPPIDLANAYLRKGTCLLRQEKTDTALSAYFKALQLFEKIGNYQRLYAITSNIANAFYKKKDTINADKYWNYAYSYSLKSNDTFSIVTLLNDRAIILFEQGLKKKANSMYKEALYKYKGHLDNDLKTKLYTNLSLCNETIDKDSAFYYYKMADSIATITKDSSHLSTIYSNLGYFYLQNSNITEATKYLELSFQFSKTLEDKLYIYYNLSEVYDSLHRFEEALLFLKKAYQLNDSIFNLGTGRISKELDEKYESGKKDEKIKSQETENKLKTRNLLLSLSALALVAALAMLSFINYRRKQKANKLLQIQNERIEKLNTELDASNQVKTKLFSVISHDIRAPISSLYAYLQLKNKSSDQNDESFINQTEHLLDTLEDLLIWSKSQLHQFVPSAEKIVLKNSITDIALLLNADMQSKQLHLSNSIPDNFILQSDINILTIVLRNLLSNAVKYALPTTIIQVEAEKNNSSVTLSIINETQASEDSLLKYSIDAAITSNSSGLGITLVNEFVAKLQGSFHYTVNNNIVTAVIVLPAA